MPSTPLREQRLSPVVGIVALVHSRLHHGNFILDGLPAYRLRMLQSVLDAVWSPTVRSCFGRARQASLDPCAVACRLQACFVDVSLIFAARFGSALPYVFERVDDLRLGALRSSATDRVVVPEYRLATIRRQSFPVLVLFSGTIHQLIYSPR